MLQAIKEYFLRGLGRINLRAKAAHYASDALTCLRDQYWKWLGEEPTNPIDIAGYLRMSIGDALESHLAHRIFPKLSVFGYHLLGTQVPVEGVDPDWHGYIDALVKTGDDEVLVVEIKTKSGYGADLLYDDPSNVSDEYLSQLGLYLKATSEAELTRKGCLLYVLLSDRHFGDIIKVNCEYDPKSKIIVASEAEYMNGATRKIARSYNVQRSLDRFKKLEEYIKKGEVPPPDYQYKIPLTDEVLKKIPDFKLRKIIDGSLIYGDWQPLYSPYKDKQLEVDGIEPIRTYEEKLKALQEYKRRHPKSKITVKEGD